MGDQAVFQGPTVLAGSLSKCMTFAYHMYGDSIGRLELLQVSANGSMSTLFSKERLNLNQWQINAIELPPQKDDYKVSVHYV